MVTSEIDVSVITRSFLVYSFSLGTVCGTSEHNIHVFVRLMSNMNCTERDHFVNIKTYCKFFGKTYLIPDLG